MATTTTMVSRYLPIDIVTNVLLRLPSKSLLRFRCVCKSWRDLVSNHKFIQLHRDLKIYGHVLIQSDWPDSTYALHCDKTFVEQTIVEFPYFHVSVLGCSNGLVCMSRGDFMDLEKMEIYLWNPSIRKLKTLPKSLLFPGLRYKTYEVIAFGFVPKTNDYRVLKILSGWVGHNDEDFVVKAEIYSLNANSWKRVENVVQVHCRANQYRILSVVNGVLYFMAKDMEDGCYEEIILSFDMADEVFGKIKIWDVYIYKHYEPKAIYPIMLGDELFFLSVRCEPIGGVDVVVDVWEKKEHGAAESWTKKLTIGHWLVPLGFLENGEVVWRYRDQVTSYDPRLPEPMDHQFDGNPWRLRAFYYYSETLILHNDEDN